MRGLVIKDLCIMKQRKNAIIMFCAILLIIGVQGDLEFVISYGTLMFGFLAQSSVAYDDDGNCMTFLMTLPVTIKEYVREKFIFTGAVVFLGWLLSTILGLTSNFFKNGVLSTQEDLVGAIITLILFMAILLAYIPVQLKYGPEVSRIVLVGAGAVIFIIALAVTKLNISLPVSLDSISPVAVLLTAILIGVLVIMGAYAWSVKILKAKEY